MKYLLMLIRSEDDWEAMTDEESHVDQVPAWLESTGTCLREGGWLEPARTAHKR